MKKVTKTITLTASEMGAVITALQSQIVNNNEMLYKTESGDLKQFLKERISFAEGALAELQKPEDNQNN